MPDAAAFLDAIREHPERDDIRLVYADWLMQQSAEDFFRGEFIKTQVELAALPSCNCEGCRQGRCGTNCGVCNKANTLRARERELLERYGQGWLPCLDMRWISVVKNDAPAIGCEIVGRESRTRAVRYEHLTFTFRRGFVDEVALSWADWGGGACMKCSGTGRGRGEFVRTNESPEYHHVQYECSACFGTGRTPGHAAAILAAQPVTKVRLTTMPRWHWTDEGGKRRYQAPSIFCCLDGRKPVHLSSEISERERIGRLLTAEWPGIAFELPPAEPAQERVITRLNIGG